MAPKREAAAMAAGDDTAPTTTRPHLTVADQSQLLYAACATQPEGRMLSQEDMLQLNVIADKDLSVLFNCINHLMAEGLLKLHAQRDGRVVWAVVKHEDAAKYRQLSVEEALVYANIESAGREGLWTRTIRNRTNMHQGVLNRVFKALESKNMIKPVQSAQHPSRKIYLLARLQPSTDVTGGAFFTDGALDDEMVRCLRDWIEDYVWAESWEVDEAAAPRQDKGKSALKSSSPSKSAHGGLKSQLLPPHTARHQSRPLPAGYKNYPTLTKLTEDLNAAGVANIRMREPDIQQLLDVLVWDGRLERLERGGEPLQKVYRSVRKRAPRARAEAAAHIVQAVQQSPALALRIAGGLPSARSRAHAVVADGDGTESDEAKLEQIFTTDRQEELGELETLGRNGLTDAPCSRCPVYNLCQEGATINPGNCVYLEAWLSR